MSFCVSYYSLSKAGRANEDRYRLLGGALVLPDGRESPFKECQRGELYGVMDGVGGASHGMAAAQYIADALPKFFTQQSDIVVSISDLTSLLNDINNEIFAWGLMEGTQRPCGASTATLLWLSPTQQAYICHVGDSAAFLLSDSGFIKATTNHEDNLGIYRYIGQGAGFVPEIRSFPITDGDVWCLVTDGVTKGLREHEIKKVLEDYAGEPNLAAKTLVESAKRKGVQDDITAVVIEVEL